MNDCLWISPGFVFVVCAATEELMVVVRTGQGKEASARLPCKS